MTVRLLAERHDISYRKTRELLREAGAQLRRRGGTTRQQARFDPDTTDEGER